MRSLTKAALAKATIGFVLAATAALITAPRAEAATSVGIYFGSGPDYPFYDPYDDRYYDCDIYDDTPWGYPDDYCLYDLWYEPVYWGGYWYNGPIYYRYNSGIPYFWLYGSWHRDQWHGIRPHNINWYNGHNIRWSSRPHRWTGHRDGSGWSGHNDGGWNGRDGSNGHDGNWNGRHDGHWTGRPGSVTHNSGDGWHPTVTDGNHDGRRDGVNRNGWTGRNPSPGTTNNNPATNNDGRNFRRDLSNDSERFGGFRGRNRGGNTAGGSFTPPTQNQAPAVTNNGGPRFGGGFRGRRGGDVGGNVVPQVQGDAPVVTNNGPSSGDRFGAGRRGGGGERTFAPPSGSPTGFDAGGDGNRPGRGAFMRGGAGGGDAGVSRDNNPRQNVQTRGEGRGRGGDNGNRGNRGNKGRG